MATTPPEVYILDGIGVTDSSGSVSQSVSWSLTSTTGGLIYGTDFVFGTVTGLGTDASLSPTGGVRVGSTGSFTVASGWEDLWYQPLSSAYGTFTVSVTLKTSGGDYSDERGFSLNFTIGSAPDISVSEKSANSQVGTDNQARSAATNAALTASAKTQQDLASLQGQLQGKQDYQWATVGLAVAQGVVVAGDLAQTYLDTSGFGKVTRGADFLIKAVSTAASEKGLADAVANTFADPSLDNFSAVGTQIATIASNVSGYDGYMTQYFDAAVTVKDTMELINTIRDLSSSNQEINDLQKEISSIQAAGQVLNKGPAANAPTIKPTVSNNSVDYQSETGHVTIYTRLGDSINTQQQQVDTDSGLAASFVDNRFVVLSSQGQTYKIGLENSVIESIKGSGANAVFAGASANYQIQRLPGFTKVVGNGSTVILRDVDKISFSDTTISGAINDTAASYVSKLLLLDPLSLGMRAEFALADTALKSGNSATLAAALALADSTTSVATVAYQFFTGSTPSPAGMAYLVSPSGTNANSLNSAYYQSFNTENRLINFAVNLGKLGAGASDFSSTYGSLSLTDATTKAYTSIFGSAPSAAKVSSLLNSAVPDGHGGTETRAQYFAYYGADGLTGIGTKAAMVGWLLSQGLSSHLGDYALSNAAYLNAIASGSAVFGVNLIGQYDQASYHYTGG